MKPQLVIPMSGSGQRFLDKGYRVPKPLIPIGGKPLVSHVLDMYPNWEDVLFIVNSEHLADKSLNLAGVLNDLRPSGKIFPVSPHKKGPGWAIRQASKALNADGPIVVNYCDFTCLWDIHEFEKQLNDRRELEGIIACYSGFHPHMLRSTKFAYVDLDSSGYVQRIQEKDSYTKTPMKEWASSGTYAFKSAKVLLDAIDEQIDAGIALNGEYYTSLSYVPILKKGKKVSVFPLKKFMQWGTPEDLEEFLYWSGKFRQIATLELSEKNLGTAIVLAAGAGKRFVDMGYELPKPILPISGSPILMQVVKGLSAGRNVIVGRADDILGAKAIDDLCRRNGFEHLELEGVSGGQADTARIALKLLDSGEEPVTIAACDSLIAFRAADLKSIFEHSEVDVIVWTQKTNPYAMSKPEHFGWVMAQGSTGQIMGLRVKETPDHIEDWESITGTFTFRDPNVAKELVDALIDSNIRVNGELYLDSIVEVCLDRGIRILAVEPHFFLSLGTPAEYETFRYWQECFHNWLQHPYRLELDPYVEPDYSQNIKLSWELDPVGRRLIG